jgi:hypothetical protein
LTLGPYRNLTTLTASLLFLHPHCQVLNHAGKRIFGYRRIDFLSGFDRAKLDRFIQYAIHISANGRRGDYGGSITLSHAFSPSHEMKDAFKDAGGETLKKTIRCLFWKESLRTSNRIRRKRIDLGKIFEQDSRLRFLLPVRNPLDCARSNIKSGHVKIFEGLNKKSTEVQVLEAILDEFVWFAGLQSRYPDRFFYFFQHEMSREMLLGLAAFLKIDPLEDWLDTAVTAMKLKPSYKHDASMWRSYEQMVREKFNSIPEFTQGLLAFSENNA